MNDPRLAKHWKVVEVQLRQAATFLADPTRFSVPERDLAAYRTYCDNGEFITALDELAALAAEVGCKPGFWRRLKKPALQMGLTKKADEFEQRFQESWSRPS